MTTTGSSLIMIIDSYDYLKTECHAQKIVSYLHTCRYPYWTTIRYFISTLSGIHLINFRFYGITYVERMQFACLVQLPDMTILCTEWQKHLYSIEMTITVHVKHQTETKAS